MQCPACDEGKISFLTVWLKGGHGRFFCSNCDAVLKMEKNHLLTFGSLCYGMLAIAVGYLFNSWTILVLSILSAFILDIVFDWKFRRLTEQAAE